MSYKTWALAHPELTYAYSLEKQRLNSALISIDYYQKRLNDPEFAWMLDHSARHLAEYQSTADYQRKILRDFNPENACTFKKSGRPRMIESALVERFYPLLSKSGFEYIINNLTSMSEDLDDNHWLAMNSLDLLRNLVNESDGTICIITAPQSAVCSLQEVKRFVWHCSFPLPLSNYPSCNRDTPTRSAR